MRKRKLKIGDRVSWKSYKSTTKGVIEKIKPSDEKTIKVRPYARFKGDRPALAALYEKNVTLL